MLSTLQVSICLNVTMTQAHLENKGFQLSPMPMKEWQIKREPLILVLKCCKKCSRYVEIWSDDAEDSDLFWCNKCIDSAEEATSEEVCPLQLQQYALIYSMANNSPHLSIRWSQSLCVSSDINK